MTFNGEEITIKTDIVELRGRQWGDENGLHVLALHGWLDNAGSFDLIAPLLKNIHLITLDFPGHGRTAHLDKEYPYSISLCVDMLLDALYQLGWDKFAIIGHSMGTAMGSLLAAKAPDRILGLVMIEGLGPLSMQTLQKNSEDVITVFWRLLKSYFRNLFYKKSSGHKIYESFEKAYQERQKYSHLSNEAAIALAKRGTLESPEGFYWSFDLRLVNTPRLLMNEKKILEIIATITTPCLLIEATDGILAGNSIVEHRKKEFKNLKTVTLPGHHHIHLENPADVAKPINEFFKTLLKQS